ncbi:MAG TPA: hypothetical protein VHK06_05130 [Candidatus Limnocylindria bacterium]|nr:hypothetical protein [Candidatus Limnocylindria bacterium]
MRALRPSPRRMARPAAAVGLAAALAIALVAAWFVPPLAVALVWPLFYLVPGMVLLDWARPGIDRASRLGLAVVLSVAVSTHLVWWLAVIAGGYGRATVFAVAATMAAAWVLRVLLTGRSAIRVRPRRVAVLARGHAGAVAVGALAAAVVGGTLAASLWQVRPDGVWTGGSNWSDLNVHLSIAQSVNAGNFPPQVPFFAGVPLVYHWFADFHAAITANAAGIFAVPAMVAQSTILAAALALVVHGLAYRLARRDRRRRAAVLAAALAVFAGGLGWTRLVGDVLSGVGEPIALVAANSYDNQWWDARGIVAWPYFRIPSVLGTGLLVHRATTAGLPILVGALLLLAAGLPSRRRSHRPDSAVEHDRPRAIWLAGLLGALLAPFHFFFFPAFVALAGLWTIAGRRLLDHHALRNAALLLAPLVLSVPFALPALEKARSGEASRFVLGWESAPVADGPAAVAFFYVTNLGLPLVLALAALLVPSVRARLFLAVWALVLFAVPNVIQVSAVAFDMNKYFQAMWIALAILAGQLVARWPAVVTAVAVILAVPSPLLAAAWTLTSQNQLLSADELAAARWVAGNTADRSVFVTSGYVNALTDPAGRLRLTSFGWYVRNLGYDPTEREAAVAAVYCARDSAAAASQMERLGAEYLVDTFGGGPCGPVNFAVGGALREVYRGGSVAIWEVAAPGAARR